MTDKELTQDPDSSGSGQDELTDARDRLSALETENQALKDQVKNIDALARRHQARADRMAASKPDRSAPLAQTPANLPGPLTPGGAVPNQAQRVADAEEEAYQAKLVTYKYQVMQSLGLTEEDVDPELELTSADAILTHMNLVAVQKQLGQSQSLTPEEVEKIVQNTLVSAALGDEGDGTIPSPEGMGGLIDTGGPSGTLASERNDKLDKMYKKSDELRRGGSLDQAGYLALRAIYADPEKVVIGGDVASDDLSDINV